MYVKFLFAAELLQHVLDELEGTPVYRHAVKQRVRMTQEELQKVLGKEYEELYRKDELSAQHSGKAIDEICTMLSEMTLNDWLHVRNAMIDYMKTPVVERMKNRARIEDFIHSKMPEVVDL